MCNLYRIEKNPDAIRRLFADVQIPITFPEGVPNIQPRNVRISETAPIVRFNEESGNAELVERRWSGRARTASRFSTCARTAGNSGATAASCSQTASTNMPSRPTQAETEDSTDNRLGRYSVCLTKEQWAQQGQADKEMARRIRKSLARRSRSEQSLA